MKPAVSVFRLCAGVSLTALTFTTALTAAMVVSTGTAQAASYEYRANQSLFMTSPGGSVWVDVYLAEVLAPQESSLIVAENGLLGARFDVEHDPLSPLPTDPALITGLLPNDVFSFAPAADVFSDPIGSDLGIFDGVNPASAGDYGYIHNFADFFGVSGTFGSFDGNDYLVYLGSVEITAGAVLGETTTFEIYNPALNANNQPLEDTSTFGNPPDFLDFTVIDSPASNIAPAIVNVTTFIPSPLSAFGGAGLLGALAMRRRR